MQQRKPPGLKGWELWSLCPSSRRVECSLHSQNPLTSAQVTITFVWGSKWTSGLIADFFVHFNIVALIPLSAVTLPHLLVPAECWVTDFGFCTLPLLFVSLGNSNNIFPCAHSTDPVVKPGSVLCFVHVLSLAYGKEFGKEILSLADSFISTVISLLISSSFSHLFVSSSNVQTTAVYEGHQEELVVSQ